MKNKKIIIIIAIALLVVGLSVWGAIALFQQNQFKLEKVRKGDPFITIEIDNSDILNYYDDLDEKLKDEKFVPKDGKVLKETKVLFKENDTPFKVIERVAKSKKIVLDVDYTYGAYVKAINNVGEKSCGVYSGWEVAVNGEPLMVGADKFELKNGDKIVFRFVCRPSWAEDLQ